MAKARKERFKRAFSWTRLKNKFLALTGNPFNVMVFVALVVLFVTVIIPLVMLISSSFTLAPPEARRLHTDPGGFTTYYWIYVFGSNMSSIYLWEPLGNSFVIATGASLISIPLGAILAWLMVRSDLPFKRVLSLCVLVPYMIPSWVKSMAWLAVFRNDRYGVPGLLTAMGMKIPDGLAYGPIAIILVLSLHYYAFTYITVSGALRSINSELEEMGAIQGASSPQILRKITFPLIMPSILSAAIMTFSKALGTYGVAANLGNRINYFTLATRMGQAAARGETSTAFVMTMVMIVLASGTIFANQIFIGTRKSYSSIGGKGGRKTEMRLGKAKIVVAAVLLVFLLVAMVMPMFILLMETFLYNPSLGYRAGNFTLRNWIAPQQTDFVVGTPNWEREPGIFQHPMFFNALWNTVRLTLIASIITALSGQILGYISSRGRGKWYGKLTEQLVFIPYLIPSVAFATMYLAMWAQPRWIIPALHGTFAILVLISVVKHFPFASRAGTANMLQIGRELEEAAEVAGAGFFRKMGKIIVPLAKQGFWSGFMLTFISIAKELDLILILSTPQNRNLSALAFWFNNEVLPQQADAVAVIIMLFVLVSYYLANRFAGADIGKSWG